MAKISIIVPFYNSEKYVKRCMNSLLHQTIGLQNLELILVDDASTDHTLDLLKEYEQQYPEQIILIPCLQNGRQGAARNIGLQYATSPYIAFVDSDDWVETDMYEKMYDKITTYDCDIALCHFVRDDGNMSSDTGDGNRNHNVYEKATGKEDSIITIENDWQREALIVNEKIGGVWDRLFKRELLLDNNILFPENLAYEDACFNSLIYLYVNRIYVLEERLYHYYINNSSTVLTMDKAYHQDIFTVGEITWQEYEKRGALERFPMAVKYHFVKCYYLMGMKMLLLRYTKPSYEVFLHIKQRVWELTGDYKENPYLKNAFPAVYDNLLKLLDLPVSEEEFLQLADIMKQLADLETQNSELH